MHDFVAQDGELLAIGHPALLPLVAQVLARGNTTQALVDPLLRVALFLVEFLHAAYGQLGVFNFIEGFFPHLGQPAFEGLGFWDLDLSPLDCPGSNPGRAGASSSNSLMDRWHPSVQRRCR